MNKEWPRSESGNRNESQAKAQLHLRETKPILRSSIIDAHPHNSTLTRSHWLTNVKSGRRLRSDLRDPPGNQFSIDRSKPVERGRDNIVPHAFSVASTLITPLVWLLSWWILLQLGPLLVAISLLTSPLTFPSSCFDAVCHAYSCVCGGGDWSSGSMVR